MMRRIAAVKQNEKDRTQPHKIRRKLRFGNFSLTTRFTIVIIIFMVIPIAILAGVLFHNMEQEVIRENHASMQYRLDETQQQIQTNLDSIHMSTRFFRADEKLLDVLNAAAEGRNLSNEELVDFADDDAADLMRMVANNPLMYSVRVYGINDNVTEMMSLLYRQSRLYNLSWGRDADITGWHIDYADTSFGNLSVIDGTTLISLVTPLNGYEHGTVGYIEAAMKMETIFPMFFSKEESDWAFYVRNRNTAAGMVALIDAGANVEDEILQEVISHGSNWPEDANSIARMLCSDKKLLRTEGTFEYKKDGRSYVVFSISQSDLGGTYLGVRDITEQIQYVYFMRNMFVILMIGIIALLWIMIDRIVVCGMLRKFYLILGTIRNIRSNQDMSIRLPETPGNTDEMEELTQETNRMLDRIQNLMRENVEREILIKNTSIKALQNQINAHFLYNVLESIKMMAEINEEYVISDAITTLGKLLRYGIRWTRGSVLMGEELEYIQGYISLMNLRNDFTVNLALNMPEELKGQEIPKMSLQPIVENAILHGIGPLGEDAAIYIKAWVEDERDTVQIEISDNGAGMSMEALEAVRAKLLAETDPDSGKGHGVGLRNVQDRIRLYFGKEYGMQVYAEEGKYTKVVLTLPYRVHSQMEEETGDTDTLNSRR